jgi:integrase
MPRPLTGSIRMRRVRANGREVVRYYARVTYTDVDGRRREIVRRAANRSEARTLIRQIIAELEGERARNLTLPDTTFDAFAREYEETHLIPPVYRQDRKIAGLRSWRTARARLRTLVAYFGRMRLRDITYQHIVRYRATRLHALSRRGTPLSIATVNRELALLRRVLHVACQARIINRHPFHDGPPLVRPAEEMPRERVLSREEEERLLAACTGRRAHLRPIIIAALDTGARRSELFALRWSDIDFEHNTIRIQTTKHSSLIRSRIVPMTTRLKDELLALREVSIADRIFAYTEIKRSFASACREAGITDLRFHDLRHTCATRLIAAGLDIAEVGRILGHTTPAMTYTYINTSDEMLERARRALEDHIQIHKRGHIATRDDIT